MNNIKSKPIAKHVLGVQEFFWMAFKKYSKKIFKCQARPPSPPYGKSPYCIHFGRTFSLIEIQLWSGWSGWLYSQSQWLNRQIREVGPRLIGQFFSHRKRKLKAPGGQYFLIYFSFMAIQGSPHSSKRRNSYDSVATVPESWVRLMAVFQSGSLVLKKVFWTFPYLYLWHTMWFHANKALFVFEL